jgi:uncharacterized protein YjbI with pentapeptide repeats
LPDTPLAARLADLETYTDLRLDGGELSGVRGASIVGGRLRGVSLAGQSFRLLHLERVVLEECDLSNCEWELPLLEEVELNGCRMTGFRIRGGKGIELTLRDCHGRYAQFEKVELKEARFERCQLGESSFLGCALDRAVFAECDLRGAVMSGVRLKGADLRGCQIDGIRASLDDLAGATLDPRQAAAILHGHAAIKVLEIGDSLDSLPTSGEG